MFLPLESSLGASAARALLVTGLLVGGAACSHQQPVSTETVRPLPGRSARAEAPRPHHPSDDGLARRGDAVATPAEPAIFFDFDSAELRSEDHEVLQHLADGFRARGSSRRQIRIEGNCDDLGTTEYNLALGERRATAAKGYLVQVGIPSAQLNVVSYGKERPVCDEHDEACWQRNRRIHVVAMAKNQ